ncbi:MAG: nucleoside hydrolase [Erysipelotrichaceae bacterium]|nr:nucleoside hydrolase [Erysipelotrichaceae bacterium]MDD3923661.1 nucleoside hydrolase [Erysipelotrichaceae bacterium]MDD4642180.1 nucleoside hydrolase [Erysipelotrichaceae bacterium]
MKRKVIIDTDPGIDDAYAIIAALNNEDLDILGITCVCGNKGIDIVVANALKLTQLLNKDISVFKGAITNMSNIRNKTIDPIDADQVHGADGLGNTNLDYDDHNLANISAIEFIINTIKKYPNEVEILALGPLTNIGLCIEKDLETMKQTKAIYSMGGGIDKGNTTPYAEFNYYYDEIATKLVYDQLQDHVKIYMIGLNATHSTRVDHNDLAFMLYEGDMIGKIIHNMTQVYGQLYYRHYGYLGAVIHDMVAYLYMIDRNVADKVFTGVAIEVKTDKEHRGQTTIKKDIKANVNVVMHCNPDIFKSLMIKSLFKDKYEKYLKVKTI